MADEVQIGVCVHKGPRCWPCMTDGCYNQPTEHVWFDSDDVQAAEEQGAEAPSGLCGCAFCGWPALGRESSERDGGHGGT